MSDDGLFPAPDPVAVIRAESLSYGRRLTMRQKADVERGIHPLMRTPLHPTGLCGTCSHHAKYGDWWKCQIGPRTAGAATDLRLWWPGCTKWEEAT